MFYIAILLIIGGLASLLFLVISQSVEKVPELKNTGESETIPLVRTEAVDEYADSSHRVDREPPDVQTPPEKEAVVQTPPPVSTSFDEPPETDGPSPHDTARDFEEKKAAQKPTGHWIDTRPLNEALKSMQKEQSVREVEPEQLIVAGLLYLDYGRQIIVRADDLISSPPGVFSEMKRAGQGHCMIRGSTINIQCDNTSYTYSTNDLDQIIFLHKGVAFVPMNTRQAVPIFITEESDLIKSFIKKHSTSKINSADHVSR